MHTHYIDWLTCNNHQIFISRQIILRIPKSNILSQPKNNQEQPIEMATLHSTPRIINMSMVGITDKKHIKI